MITGLALDLEADVLLTLDSDPVVFGLDFRREEE
jgi:hypothetical protein